LSQGICKDNVLLQLCPAHSWAGVTALAPANDYLVVTFCDESAISQYS
jgi:hypothetical protein